MRLRRPVAPLLLAPLLAASVAACSAAPSVPVAARDEGRLVREVGPAPSTSAVAPAAPEAPPTTTVAPPPAAVPARAVVEQAWTPFAVVDGVVLHHPSSRVERVGFHESNHDGARQLTPLPTAAAALTLESRERDTGPRGSADVVVDPDVEIRSPVTGRVLRAGTYVLYCDHRDDYAVIEPDARPGWEVKILHIDGVAVRRGDRVVAGETLLAARPTRLPFDSQVDETTASPAWPHVHIEVVDPTIPDRPSGGSC